MVGHDSTEPQSADERLLSAELSTQHVVPPIRPPGYRLERFLGAGTYGEVWVGIDRNTGRRVAIKFFHARASVDAASLTREVEKLVFLSSDRYVVQLLDVGWDAEPPYYVMDYIEQGSLEDCLSQGGELAVDAAVELFHEIAVGLTHLHNRGVLHCDLKPANVLLDEDHKPRLADFGQARLAHESSPALGTMFYMAPEQADLQALPDARWDVYSLGAILYCMLVGHPPYRNPASIAKVESTTDLEDRLAIYRSSLVHAPRPSEHRLKRGVDRNLADIVDRCLALEPEQRFQSPGEVLEALRVREQTRAARPLLLLGLVVPSILLLLMATSGWWMIRQSVDETQAALSARTIEGNGWAAQFAARKRRGTDRSIPRVRGALRAGGVVDSSVVAVGGAARGMAVIETCSGRSGGEHGAVTVVGVGSRTASAIRATLATPGVGRANHGASRSTSGGELVCL
ncbi:MAG: serine/threonine-protein kinase [Pirellulaceae bacterium]